MGGAGLPEHGGVRGRQEPPVPEFDGHRPVARQRIEEGAQSIGEGLGIEPVSGILVQAQYALPAQAPRDDQALFVTLTLNNAHLGVSGGAMHGRTGSARGDGWITGVRLSQSRYRPITVRPNRVAVIDLTEAMATPAAPQTRAADTGFSPATFPVWPFTIKRNGFPRYR